MPVLLHIELELPGYLKGRKHLPLYKNPEESLGWLQEHVFAIADRKAPKNGLTWLGIGAAPMFLLLDREKEEAA